MTVTTPDQRSKAVDAAFEAAVQRIFLNLCLTKPNEDSKEKFRHGLSNACEAYDFVKGEL
jgi:hypothetical protein